jgi:hypothetical protein
MALGAMKRQVRQKLQLAEIAKKPDVLAFSRTDCQFP